jgi:hypothetical protein
VSCAAQAKLRPTTAIVVAVLLGTPILALVTIPIYARNGPELWGFPFFYWYQFGWLFLTSAMTAAAHRVITRARRASAYAEGPR